MRLVEHGLELVSFDVNDLAQERCVVLIIVNIIISSFLLFSLASFQDTLLTDYNNYRAEYEQAKMQTLVSDDEDTKLDLEYVYMFLAL
jgi:hypothetical protein